MKKQTRLYNIILPIWMIVALPSPLWLAIIPGNLAVDCVVLFFTLLALKHTRKGGVVKQLWWKFWLLGFAADAVGVVWMLLGMLGYIPFGDRWENTVSHVTHNAFHNPWAFLWTLIGVALAGVCVYFFDRRAMKSCDLLTGREKHIVALTMAIVTAPYLFFIPAY
ncbi:MAG: hypothetical protein HDT38_06530 [Clostridiales bacterium]|nr:hypothetical protein [Clostridiales bacterium]